MIGISKALSSVAHAICGLTEQLKNNNNTNAILNRIAEMEKRMAEQLDDIIEDIEEQKTLIAGVGTLVTGLKQQLKDALAGVTLPPAVAAKIAKIWADTEANKQALADALVAGTPEGPAEPSGPPSPA